MDRKNELLFRVYVVMLFFIAFALMILWQAFNISFIQGEKWRDMGVRYMKWAPVKAERGSMYADDGSILVTSQTFFDIRFDPSPKTVSNKLWNKEINDLCKYLAKYSGQGKSRAEWKSYLNSKRNGNEPGSRNLLLVKKANYDLYKKFKKFPILKYGQYRGGLIVDYGRKRIKPFGGLASRLIGEDRDHSQKVGLEASYDKVLKGKDSQRLMRKVEHNVWVPVEDPADVGTEKGSDIITTIDIDLQDIMHYEMLRCVIEQEALMGCAVLMDVETGAIKAMTNLTRTTEGKYAEGYNHAVLRQSEPGSTFKLASTMALLESKKVTAETSIKVDGGEMMFYDRKMKDSDYHGHDYLTLKQSFVKSSNVGLGHMSFKVFGKKGDGWRAYAQSMKNLNITGKTGIDLIGETTPKFKDPDSKYWYGTTVPWMSHGYSLTMTPLQVLNLYNAVANNGKMMKPYLVSAIESEGEVIKKYEPKVLKQNIASRTTIESMQEMLVEVVESGTAKSMRSDKYSLAGKTGTSSTNYDPEKNKKKEHNASFAGYFPADNPKYSMIVVIYEPKKEYYGGQVAGPVFKAIADRCFALKLDLINELTEKDKAKLDSKAGRAAGYSEDFQEVFAYSGIDYKKNTNRRWVSTRKNNDGVSIEKKAIKNTMVPDVRNMGLRDAVYILENMGLSVKIHGAGKVSRQTQLPGTKLTGQEIEIYLN